MPVIRIDLCGDTVTRPTQAMREFMAAAPVGDEQKREDPTVNQLGEMVCDLLGKEDAIYLPSGTMCNQIARRLALGLAEIEGITVDPVETNMVYFDVGGLGLTAGEFAEQTLDRGLRFSIFG